MPQIKITYSRLIFMVVSYMPIACFSPAPLEYCVSVIQSQPSKETFVCSGIRRWSEVAMFRPLERRGCLLHSLFFHLPAPIFKSWFLKSLLQDLRSCAMHMSGSCTRQVYTSSWGPSCAVFQLALCRHPWIAIFLYMLACVHRSNSPLQKRFSLHLFCYRLPRVPSPSQYLR